MTDYTLFITECFTLLIRVSSCAVCLRCDLQPLGRKGIEQRPRDSFRPSPPSPDRRIVGKMQNASVVSVAPEISERRIHIERCFPRCFPGRHRFLEDRLRLPSRTSARRSSVSDLSTLCRAICRSRKRFSSSSRSSRTFGEISSEPIETPAASSDGILRGNLRCSLRVSSSLRLSPWVVVSLETSETYRIQKAERFELTVPLPSEMLHTANRLLPHRW